MERASEEVCDAGLNHRDIYVLIVGVIVGVLLGPAVLGRLVPGTYDRLFATVEEAQLEAAVLDRDIEATRQRLRDTGVTDAALVELDAGFAEKQRQLRQRLDWAIAGRARMTAVIFALVILMLLETLVARHDLWRARLTHIRYACVAVLLALLLAQPRLLREVSVSFLALLILVALAASVIPLRRSPGA